MTLTKKLQQLQTRFQIKLPNNFILKKAIYSLVILAVIAAVVWILGPEIRYGAMAPLAHAEKRIYFILVLFLLMTLKFLIFDLDAPNPFQFKDAATRLKVTELQNRFIGALKFLKRTTVTRQNKNYRLNQLPSYLLIGPANAGKTALLASANVNYVLSRQLQNKDLQKLEATDNCDWWVTRDASIIDVPGKYISVNGPLKNTQQGYKVFPVLWRFFLRLFKKYQGKNPIDGILIALPLPEIMKQQDPKKYQALLHDVFQRLHELHKIFPQPIPCQLVITKCDLLSGFVEFFGESDSDEISQAWGVTVPELASNEKMPASFASQLDALIKTLNEQLLWRLHQERNPMHRPFIKDFPLQVERLKEFTLDLIKKFSAANIPLPLQAIYLTSAMQVKTGAEVNIFDQPIDSQQRGLQIFRAPASASRSYFTKQLLTQGISYVQPVQVVTAFRWKTYTAYAASAAVVIATGVLLGRDFQQGIKQTYAIQNHLAEYQATSVQILDPNEHLIKTTSMLNTLYQASQKTSLRFEAKRLISFYSIKSQEGAGAVYQQTLQTVLLPEIKNYLADYLKNPINKSADNVYAAFKSYLMLGDAAHIDRWFIVATLREILPQTVPQSSVDHLTGHLAMALSSAWQPMMLDAGLVTDTRKYFMGLQALQLSYIILKNTDSNNRTTTINLGVHSKPDDVFTSQQLITQMPNMFTAKNFAAIATQESFAAAEEALNGNWVLGINPAGDNNPATLSALTDQLRMAYLNNYIEVWEGLLSNIHLSGANDLNQLDNLVANLISDNSPLLKLLQTFHDNTFFEPVASASPKLQNLGLLVEKNTQSQQQLLQIFTSLRSLHVYLQTVINANNEKKAAFEIISSHMQHTGTPDVITQMRQVAEQSPEPIKNWLDSISSQTWRFLMKDASRYLDTSWQQQVAHVYDSAIANRYPFEANSDLEVDIQKFIHFFGSPGVLMDFYNGYLKQFVDTSSPDWRWKTFENEPLPLSEETLRQIQQAVKINRSFFPNGDNKLYVQFALQPYKFGKQIKNVKLTINDKQFIDSKTGSENPHLVAWPSAVSLTNATSVQLTLANEQIIKRTYPGNWGLFKLVNQSIENMVSKKEFLINISMNEYPVKYLLYTDAQLNPFMITNLSHFRLPPELAEKS